MKSRPRSGVIPTLRYCDARSAIDWLCDAFGFERRMVVQGHGGTIVHAQLVLASGMIMVSSVRETELDALQRPPAELGGLVSQSAYVVVPDIDRHFAHALAAGAVIVVDLQSEPHGRGYSCRDPEGHIWHFGDYDPWSDE